MNISDLKKKIPDSPGVYFFLGPRREILYIGKATSIRDRVRSYFAGDMLVARGPKIVVMLEKTREVKWRTTDSVLEALLLESYLIKQHQPPYNTDEKDDKSWNYVVITKEKFPRVLLVRGKDLVLENREQRTINKKQKTKNTKGFIIRYQFGPFSQGGMLNEALKIVRRIFPYRDRCMPAGETTFKKSLSHSKHVLQYTSVLKYVSGSEARPCFNAQIGLCPGMCAGKISAQEYAKTIHHVKLFFEGKKKTLVKRLEREMKGAAGRMEFEKANELKHTLFALGHIQDVALLKRQLTVNNQQLTERTLEVGSRTLGVAVRIEAYDVAHLSGQDVVGVMTVMEDGSPNKSQYRKFKLHHGNNDVGNLEEMLARRLKHPEWPAADILVVDGAGLQLQAAEKALRVFGSPTPVVAVVKDRRHQPKEILGSPELTEKYRDMILLSNAEAHRFAITFHRKRRKKSFLEPV